MTKSNIYETNWTDLVFENKNKEYGAYQLRQESSKNTVTALFAGLLLLAGLGSASVLINKFGAHGPVETEPTVFSVPIRPTDIPIPVQPQSPAPPVAPQQTAAASPVTSTQLVNPVVTAATQATPDVIATNADNHPVVDHANTGTGNAVNALPASGGGVETTALTGESKDPVNVAILDKLPEFPGGMAKFYTYVGNNFNRPELDAERTLRVYVSFVIEKDGSITDIMVKNDPGYGIGKEAIRVLKSLKTKWSPGILNGNPVRTAYNLPITIKTE
ncbi:MULTISPECIES: energy transducer TonB [Flavobacterium]|uniref:Energy transducer TonB n=1 Tax=Flavobacterium lipolyticum TaxID=2893754 RepID=A0ABS8LWW7_9FLAO|nr:MULTISPECIES: energy transducer TonB [unclassified Flavobacterium]MCC9017045.1 energy transducer TonB [Flavobacterium sp. F-126]